MDLETPNWDFIEIIIGEANRNILALLSQAVPKQNHRGLMAIEFLVAQQLYVSMSQFS